MVPPAACLEKMVRSACLLNELVICLTNLEFAAGRADLTYPCQSLAAVNAPTRFSVWGALNELRAVVEQLYVVERCLVVRVKSQRRLKLGARRLEIAAQHIGIPFVIQQPDGDALKFACGRVSLIS